MARLDDIRRSVIEAVNPLPAEGVDRAFAGGRWLAEAAVARVAAPPYSCSAMDGFALRAEDLAPAQPLQDRVELAVRGVVRVVVAEDEDACAHAGGDARARPDRTRGAARGARA